MASKAAGWTAAVLAMMTLSSTASGATDFVSVKPLKRVEYWQQREAAINAAIVDTKSLRDVRLLFVGDSITDFWLLGDNPWVKGKRCGRKVWDESFGQRGSANFAFNIGISGDRTEHLLYRLQPRAQGGLGQIDAPELNPEFIVLLVGINNSWAAEEPVADSVFEGVRAVIHALHAGKPKARIILQTLLPTNEEPRNDEVVRPVNRRLVALAASPPYADYVTLLDLYPAFVDASGKQIDSLFNDGLHPSEAGYRVWRDQLVPFLDKTRTKPRQ
jgi:lysophospholipase L1-like esterase